MLKRSIMAAIYFGLLLVIQLFYCTAEAKPEDSVSGITSGTTTIFGELDSYQNIQDIEGKIRNIREKNEKIRAKILSIQDHLYLKYSDVAELQIVLRVKENPEQKNMTFDILDLQANLNDDPLITYNNFLHIAPSQRYPLFKGLIPFGKYKLELRASVGVLLHGWPHASTQGRWKVEKIFEITVKKSSKFSILLNNRNNLPTFEIADGVQDK